jgi:hypothetical protein
MKAATIVVFYDLIFSARNSQAFGESVSARLDRNHLIHLFLLETVERISVQW